MLEPHVIVVCDDDTKLADSRHVTAYAVIQSDLIYTLNSIFEAVDMCIKGVFAFNLQFPPAAHGVCFLFYNEQCTIYIH